MAAAKLTAAEVALHNAISSGDEATVRARLAQVANVNCVDDKGDFPLIKAVRSGNRGVVQALLDRGANVNATNKAGSSALVAAGMNGHADIAAALLSRGANINQRTAGYDSAVSLAVWKNHTDVALLLIQQNAAVDTQDKFGDCPLHDSAKHGNIKLITPLLAKLPHRLNARNAKGQTPLHCAAMHGHGDAVRILLAHGADTSIIDEEKKAAYDHAANEEVNKLLSPNHLKQIEQVLHESKLKFEDKSNDENAPHFRFLLVRPQPIELQEIKIQLSRKATLIVYSSCTQRIPVARRGPAAEFIARVNFDLPAAGGNFELDMRDGEVRYKTSFGFNKISDIKEMTRVFIAEHSTLYEPYLLAAVDVGKGADPKQRYGELKKKMGL